MAALPYMPLYISDYMADTNHLSTLEHGAYLLLIMNYWQTGKSLPDDDRKLAKICRLSEKNFKKIKFSVSEFFLVNSGFWVHERIEFELEKVRKKSITARFAGQMSAKKRLEKVATDVERPLNVCSTNVERLSNHTDTDTDTETRKEKTKAKKKNFFFVTQFEKFWELYPRKVGRSKCEQKFMTLCQSKIDAEKIIAGLEKYLPVYKTKEPEFIPHPLTWLNQQRWDDEIKTEKKLPQPKFFSVADAQKPSTPEVLEKNRKCAVSSIADMIITLKGKSERNDDKS